MDIFILAVWYVWVGYSAVWLFDTKVSRLPFGVKALMFTFWPLVLPMLCSLIKSIDDIFKALVK